MVDDLSKAIAIYGFKAPPRRQIEYAGIAYECNLILHRVSLGQHAGRVLRGDENGPCSSNDSSSNDLTQENLDEFMDADDNKYQKYMAKLDPSEFKEQDHYRVLGLSKLRYKATMGQIKMAYRQKVLVYHPDKGKASKNGSRNEAIFACIQKAYEILGVEMDKRRSYDSVDPKFDETVPDASDINTKNFYDLLIPVFERHSRFSITQPTPHLGNPETIREDVERFYDFWFEFKSWREFSYNDKEDKSRAEDKWERREIEKMNRVDREQSRKKYMKKLLAFVEAAYEKDPRIAQFRESDKQRKQDKKNWKRLEKQRLAEEKESEERKRKAELEEERQKAEEQAKTKVQEKQRVKEQLKTNQQRLRDLVHEKQYFSNDPKVHSKVMEGVERVCMKADLERLNKIIERLSGVVEVTEVLDLLSLKKGAPNGTIQSSKTVNSLSSDTKVVVWEQDEILLLIKATNIYPAGSVERWAQVAKYINDHSKNGATNPKNEKDIIKEVKRVKSGESTNVLSSQNSYVAPKPTNNVEESQQQNGEDTWSPAEQKQLETALKSTDPKDPERWEKIAKAVEGKTKKQCVQRYKHIVQMVKQHKEAAMKS